LSIKNAKAKGNRNEYKSRDMYIERGFEVQRAAGSLGMFDLIALSTYVIHLVQVKSNHLPSPAERKLIENHHLILGSNPKDAEAIYYMAVIHVWKDHARQPIIYDWEPDAGKWANRETGKHLVERKVRSKA
jgi:hypothetical protein